MGAGANYTLEIPGKVCLEAPCPHARQPSSHTPDGWLTDGVAPTSRAQPTFDAWAAAEADLKYQADAEARREEMRHVKLAAAIGSDAPVALGF